MPSKAMTDSTLKHKIPFWANFGRMEKSDSPLLEAGTVKVLAGFTMIGYSW